MNATDTKPNPPALQSILDRRQELGMKEYVRLMFKYFLRSNGFKSGLVAEIGGPKNSFAKNLPSYEFEFLSIFPVPERDDVRVADITNCPHVPSDRYDAVFSLSVFEHVKRPWDAGREIQRIVKPGGIVFNAAPFSYFYHKAPEDYWRMTPAGFDALFPELDTLHQEFYGRNRRRDNRGTSINPVDGDGGEQFAVDMLGGWRENWFTIHVARAPLDKGAHRNEVARSQMMVNLIKRAMELKYTEDEAIARVAEIASSWDINDGQLVPTDAPIQPAPTVEDVETVWKTRKPGNVKVTPERFAQAAIVGLDKVF